MASEVDICNLALSHLGDSATVSSINPPDGSAQAEHCSRFYPIARDTLLESETWKFATRRALLAEVDQPFSQWRHAYALPDGFVQAIAVLPPDASDDYSQSPTPDNYPFALAPPLAWSMYTPQAYTIETDANGNQVLYTNQENALLRYTVVTTDAAKFTPLFTMALSWSLASLLAGPILKGEAGSAAAIRCLQMYQMVKQQAAVSDAVQRSINVQQIVPWMAGR